VKIDGSALCERVGFIPPGLKQFCGKCLEHTTDFAVTFDPSTSRIFNHLDFLNGSLGMLNF